MVYQRKYNYEYRDGWHPSVDANTVGSVIEEIEDRNGSITSELFLEASRAEDSPTHGVFEWDDNAAAEKYRLHQAAKTICSIRVVIRASPEQEPKPRRAFVNIVPADESKRAQYVNVCDALANEETRRVVLQRAIKELKSFQDKYENLSELAGVIKAIKEVRV